jgi:predicted helicase
MPVLDLKANSAAIQQYYRAVEQYRQFGIEHEGGVRTAFQNLLDHCARQFGLAVEAERRYEREGCRPARINGVLIDGVLVDTYGLEYGYWEAKDLADNLEKKIQRKLADGYPTVNTLFQTPNAAVLYQHGQRLLHLDIRKPEQLLEILKNFFEYRRPAFENWEKAVELFQQQVPNLAQALFTLIEKEKVDNKRFKQALEHFTNICRDAINPNISDYAIKEMLVQHLLTERIFRKIFNNPDFTRRNAIAAAIEKVIDALTSKSFSRDEFLRRCDNFYIALEEAAATIEDFTYKQHFLNRVYERFFQSFSAKVADTHGIVYTPQSIVDFMVESVEELLQQEFGRSLSDPGVNILDPFVGTGNFIVRIIKQINKVDLEQKYHNELHCNEVMLLPYYIASMNIEHEYFDATKEYQPFPGICFVDTFELAEKEQLLLFNEENTKRVQRQQENPIFVIIGNPPYNVGQINENDNNKNRKYEVMDKRIKDTYARESNASNKNALSDVYIKAIRWATDRLGEQEEGIVAFVTNNSFVQNIAFDGLRKCLSDDFAKIYILDLGGNVRQNPKLSGTTHNVFGIQVGVSINILVRKKRETPASATVYYSRMDEFWRKTQKYQQLDIYKNVANVQWQQLQINSKDLWITEGLRPEFDHFLPLGTKETKRRNHLEVENVVFKTYSSGVKTNRDAWVYNFSYEMLCHNVKNTADTYNLEVARLLRLKKSERDKVNIGNFVTYDDQKISWSRDLKLDLTHGHFAKFESEKVRTSLYRPFTKSKLFFDRVLNEEVYVFPAIFPTIATETENRVICVSDKGHKAPFTAIMTNVIPEVHICAADASQAFPFYCYNEDGSNRRENITDWALNQFRQQFNRPDISKWDIFYYIYGVLHHPNYRENYAANLKRELPRVPYCQPFHKIAAIGRQLAELHINYEKQPAYQLKRVENRNVPLSFKVKKMRLNRDKTELIYNDSLTLTDIPVEVYDYKLGSRSALEWIIEQYQVTIDKRSGIVNDPNREAEPHYILDLVGQVITVSLETRKLVKELQMLVDIAILAFSPLSISPLSLS